MKKMLIPVMILIMCSLTLTTFSQAKKSVPAKKATPAVTSAPMKNSLDSFSYAIGLSIAGFYKQQGVTTINNNMVIKALNDVKNGKPLLNDEQSNDCIVSFVQTVNSKRASPNKKEGEAFLAENKKKEGIIELPSGLQYQVLQEGTGAKPMLTDKVKVHYHGTLIDGTIFDSSVQRGEPLELNVNGVIPGWTEALQLMPVGSKWKLFIPSSLGYGDNPAGAIKPGSTLIFDVELIDIVK